MRKAGIVVGIAIPILLASAAAGTRGSGSPGAGVANVPQGTRCGEDIGDTVRLIARGIRSVAHPVSNAQAAQALTGAA